MPISRRSALGLLMSVAALPTLLPTRAGADQPPRIGVIGAGWLGGTVGLGGRAMVGTPAQAAALGSVLLFATPYDALPELGRELAASLRGKVVLDACNPSPDSSNPLTREHHGPRTSPTDGTARLTLTPRRSHACLHYEDSRMKPVIALTGQLIASGAATQPGHEVDIQRHSSERSKARPSEYFTGAVRIESRFQAPAPARAAGAVVHFEAGARTAWHTHPLGQTLIVTSGSGWVRRPLLCV